MLQTVEEKLCHQIVIEFGSDEIPQAPEITEGDEDFFFDTGAFWGKSWEDLSFEIFHENMYVFFTLPDDVFPYFFGAHLNCSILEGQFASDAMINFLESPETKPNRSIFRMTVRNRLNVRQRTCFREVLSHFMEKPLDDDTREYLQYNFAKLVETI